MVSYLYGFCVVPFIPHRLHLVPRKGCASWSSHFQLYFCIARISVSFQSQFCFAKKLCSESRLTYVRISVNNYNSKILKTIAVNRYCFVSSTEPQLQDG